MQRVANSWVWHWQTSYRATIFHVPCFNSFSVFNVIRRLTCPAVFPERHKLMASFVWDRKTCEATSPFPHDSVWQIVINYVRRNAGATPFLSWKLPCTGSLLCTFRTSFKLMSLLRINGTVSGDRAPALLSTRLDRGLLSLLGTSVQYCRWLL